MPIQYRSPGVKIETPTPAAKAITGVSTETLGLLGLFKKGPMGVVTKVTSWDEFCKYFGGLYKPNETIGELFGPQVAHKFFLDGSKELYVVRTAHYSNRMTTAVKASKTIETNYVKYQAKYHGVYGNLLKVASLRYLNAFTSVVSLCADGQKVLAVGSAAKFQPNVDIFVQGDGASTACNDAYLLNSVAAGATTAVVTVTSQQGTVNWAEKNLYVIFGENSTRMFDGEIRKVATFSKTDNNVTITFDKPLTRGYSAGSSTNKNVWIGEVRYISAIDGNNLTVDSDFSVKHEVGAKVIDIVVRIDVYDGKIPQLVESVDGLGLRSGHSKYIKTYPFQELEVATWVDRAENVENIAREDWLAGGDDGLTNLDQSDFTGADRQADKNGLWAFDFTKKPFNFVMPDVHKAANPEISLVAAASYIGGREDMYMFCSGPYGKNFNGANDENSIQYWLNITAGLSSDWAALYYPWIKVQGVDGSDLWVPPEVGVVGVCARTDKEIGVHKAPAGALYPMLGVFDVEVEVSDKVQEDLFPRINAVRKFPGYGIIVWGARSLSAGDYWKFINVKRTFIFAGKSIGESMMWVPFEPNDEELWAKIDSAVRAFCMLMWRGKMLKGAKPDEAFYVKCDSSLNTEDTIEAGQVITEVGLAVKKPSEFVVFRLLQWKGGYALVSA